MIQRVFRFGFSNGRSTPMTSNLRLYYPQGYAKQFKIPHESSTKEFVDLLRKEESQFSNISVTFNGKDYTNDSIPFHDLVLHNSPQLLIDNHNYSFQLDLTGAAPYYSNCELQQAFMENEIPYFDASVISRFHELFKQNLKQNTQSYTPQEIQATIERTLTKFAEENHSNSEHWQFQQKILQNMDTTIGYYQQIFDEVKQQAQKEGHSLLKKLIIFALAQYVFLLYLTYGMYDWSVSEPISYLLGQTMETVALFYFLRKGYLFKQGHLYKNKFDKTFNTLINKRTNSTNFIKELEFAKQKAELMQAKIIYGTTSL